MEVKIKKLHPEAVIPSYSKVGDCGMDLTAVSFEKTANYFEYGTGLALEIPAGFVGLLFPRSSIANQSLALCNAVGVVDENYRGEVKLRFKLAPSNTTKNYIYDVGDRVAQLVIIPYPKIEFTEVTEELSTTERGALGFGSSGN